MKIIYTAAIELATQRFRVAFHMADADKLEDANESIAITAVIETENDTPYLKEVQRGVLERALRVIVEQIEAQKTAPHRSA